MCKEVKFLPGVAVVNAYIPYPLAGFTVESQHKPYEPTRMFCMIRVRYATSTLGGGVSEHVYPAQPALFTLPLLPACVA